MRESKAKGNRKTNSKRKERKYNIIELETKLSEHNSKTVNYEKFKII
jgi:hypothetical protein